MRKILGPTVLIAAALVGLIWLRPHQPLPPQPADIPTLAATAAPASTSARPSAQPTTASQPAAATTTATAAPASLRTLQGRALAQAWLTGYLTRSSRTDGRWVAAITDLSTPDLIAELRRSDPDSVGLDQLASWRVTKVEPYQMVDRPLDTPTRRTLAYAASVTDGHRTGEKPFELYSYLQADGRWVIAAVDQPYSSEG